jgi:RNA processing factor Prp31
MNRSYSKIRNIQESNLRLEKQFIKESSDNVQNKIIQTISSLKSVDDINNYFTELNNTYAPDSSKLVLIFPKYGQYSVVASTIYLLGINAQVFTSINDCVKVLNNDL